MDKNFSTLFTVWDRLFGTLYKNYDEYPDTGIAGYRFPLETSAKGLSTLETYWAQTIYPFRLICERIGKVFYSEKVGPLERFVLGCDVVLTGASARSCWPTE